jgi:hypothetical protein
VRQRSFGHCDLFVWFDASYAIESRAVQAKVRGGLCFGGARVSK